MKKFLISAASLALAMASPASAATEIFYSNFEDENPGQTSDFVVKATAGVWTKEANTAGIELQFGATGGATADPATNRVKVELDSFSNSGMFYTFVDSGIFTLDFLFSPRPNVGPLSNVVKLLLDSDELGVYSGGPNATTVWSQQLVGPFTAFAGQKLIFRAEGTNDSLGGYLDNIRLTQIGAVPEPSTWLFMLMGFAAVGYTMRRKQNLRVNFA